MFFLPECEFCAPILDNPHTGVYNESSKIYCGVCCQVVQATGIKGNSIMKIIIGGCGKIGETLLAALVSEGHDVVALDNDPAVIAQITGRSGSRLRRGTGIRNSGTPPSARCASLRRMSARTREVSSDADVL